jgi:hypothetical protein
MGMYPVRRRKITQVVNSKSEDEEHHLFYGVGNGKRPIEGQEDTRRSPTRRDQTSRGATHFSDSEIVSTSSSRLISYFLTSGPGSCVQRLRWESEGV